MVSIACFNPLMPTSLKRLLIALSLLYAGPLAQPGQAAGEPYPFSPRSLDEAALVRSPVNEPSVPDSYRSFGLELGHAQPFVEHQGPEDSSEARPPAGPPEPTLDPAPGAASASVAVSPYVVHDRPEVRHFVDRFQTGYRRAVVERWLSRSGRYLGMIREVFAQRGLPEELVFTAMIESGFDPVAVSRAGAKGLWQFMAPTARRYGLRVDRWIDERLDPEKSTWAAASYLTDLFTMFGSWHLVQAAYNAGEMRVARAVQSKQTSDFWQLSRTRLLAEETKSFVAATQAAALIGREPDRYGFSFTPEDPLRYEVIQVPPSMTLERLAGMSGIATANLRRLNPELRLAQTPPGKPYALKVPVGGEAAVRAAFQKAAAATLMAATKRGRGRDAATTSQARPPARGVHVVKAQETVGAIAKRYGVSAAEIVRWNLLSAAGRIFPGDRLRVARVAPAEEEGQGGFR